MNTDTNTPSKKHYRLYTGMDSFDRTDVDSYVFTIQGLSEFSDTSIEDIEKGIWSGYIKPVFYKKQMVIPFSEADNYWIALRIHLVTAGIIDDTDGSVAKLLALNDFSHKCNF